MLKLLKCQHSPFLFSLHTWKFRYYLMTWESYFEGISQNQKYRISVDSSWNSYLYQRSGLFFCFLQSKHLTFWISTVCHIALVNHQFQDWWDLNIILFVLSQEIVAEIQHSNPTSESTFPHTDFSDILSIQQM